MEQIKAMFDTIGEDTVFGEEISALITKGNAADIIAAAAKKGFNFTEADWQAYLDWSKTIGGEKKGELSESELEDVAGGGFPWDPHTSHECWFHAASEAEYRDGEMRKRCNQFACKAPVGYLWFQCRCYGKDVQCKNGWHKADSPGCLKRGLGV